MTESVIIFYECHSCENCHLSKRIYGAQVTLQCTEDTNIVFVQNRDTGIPANCPFRLRKPT